MALRLYSEFTSNEGTQWKIEIYDRSFSSSSFSFSCNGFRLNYSTPEDERESPLKTSKIIIQGWNNDSDFDTFITDLVARNQTDVQVKILKDAVIYWAGNVLTDISILEDMSKPYIFNIEATDGLAMLKDLAFDNDGTLYTGFDRIIEHLNKILTKTDLLDFWSASDYYLREIVNWQEKDMAAGSTIYNTEINHSAFIFENDEELQALNCYEVLEQICRLFFVRFYLAEGQWMFAQIPEFDNNSLSTYKFKKDNTNISENKDYRITPDRLAGGSTTFFPALKTIKVEYKYKQGYHNNLLKTQDDYKTAVDIGNVDGGSNEKLIFKGILYETYEGGAPADAFYSVFDLRIKVGIYYLEGNVGDPRFKPRSPENLEWTSTSTNKVKVYTDYKKMKGDYQHPFYFSFITPEITGGSDACEFEFDLDEHHKSDGDNFSPVGTYDYETKEFDLQIIFTGGITQEGIKQFKAENDNANKTEIVKKLPETILGNGVNTYSDGRLKIYNGASWVNADEWEYNADANYFDINQLKINEILRGQSVLREKYQGVFVGKNLTANSIIAKDSKKFILIGANFNANMDEWSGEWFEIDRNTPTITSTSKEKKPTKVWDGLGIGSRLDNVSQATTVKIHKSTEKTPSLAETWEDADGMAIVADETQGNDAEMNADGINIDILKDGIYSFGGCLHPHNATGSGWAAEKLVLARILKTLNAGGIYETKCSQRGFSIKLEKDGEQILSYNGTVDCLAGDKLKLQYYVSDTDVTFYSNPAFSSQVAYTFWVKYDGNLK